MDIKLSNVEHKTAPDSNIKLSEYWLILGKVFEWVCYEGDEEVSLSIVHKVGNKYEMKTKQNSSINKSELCIATMYDSLKLYDKIHRTNYYNIIISAIDKTKKGIPLVMDIQE